MKLHSITKFIAIISVWGLFGVAQAYTINDIYVGADNNGWGDRIGDASYEVQGMDVSYDNDWLNVRVWTNFDQGVDNYGVEFGDLFISTNGWNPSGSASNGYLYDNASNGENWEFVFDTSAGGLYGGNFSISLSDNMLDRSRYIFRYGQEVQRKAGGDFAGGGSSVDLSNTGVGGYINYSISLAALGLGPNANLGFKWGMTCANDTIEGAIQYAQVPEASSLWLFGIGMLGMGFIGRRRKI